MSHADHSSFADRLMNSEPSSAELRRRYREGALALVERRLTPWQRRIGWLSLALNGGLIVGLAHRSATAGAAEPRAWLELDAAIAVGLLAMGLWTLRVLRSGSRVTWRDDRAMGWIAVIGLGGLSFALSGVASSLVDVRLALGIYGAIALLMVGGGGALLIERFRRSNLETRVKLLELELRVSELSRTIAPPAPDAPAP